MSQNNQINQKNINIDKQYKCGFGIVVFLSLLCLFYFFIFDNNFIKPSAPLIVTLIVISFMGIYGFLGKDNQALFIIKYFYFSLIPVGVSFIILSSIKRSSEIYNFEDVWATYIIIIFLTGFLNYILTVCIFKDKCKKEDYCIFFISLIISFVLDFISFYLFNYFWCEVGFILLGIILIGFISSYINKISNC